MLNKTDKAYRLLQLPTGQVEMKTEDDAIIRAEAYGNGIDMWLRNQGDKIEIL